MMDRMKHFLSLTAMVVIACSAVSAQQVTEIKQPGDVIRLEIKFDGLDAHKVKQVVARLDRISPASAADQVGFTNNFQGDWIGEASPNTFHADITIPKDVSTGDYRLSIAVQAVDGRTQYTGGEQFQTALFHIRNPSTFTPPHIEVTLLTEKK